MNDDDGLLDDRNESRLLNLSGNSNINTFYEDSSFMVFQN